MKWYKFFILFFFLFRSHPPISLMSTKNDFKNKFDIAISSSKLKIANITYREFINQVDFDIDNCHIIFSTLKNPEQQLITLQEATKVAKIKGSTISLINLSQDHSYATLKNN